MSDPDPLYAQIRRANHLTIYSPTSRKSPFRALLVEVLLPVGAAFFCAISGVAGGAVAMLTTDLYMAIAGLALAIGSLVAGLFLAIQLRRYHERMFLVREYDLDPAGDENQERGPQQIVVNGGGQRRIITYPRGPKVLEYGNIRFVMSGENLDQLRLRLQAGDKGIRRDTAGELLGFSSLPEPITSGRYSSALAALRGLGLVDDRSEWTAAGVQWLMED